MGLSGFPQDVRDSIINKANKLAGRVDAVTLRSREMEIVRSLVKSIELEKEAAGYRLLIDIYALVDLLEITLAETVRDVEVKVALKLQTCNNGKKVIINNAPTRKPKPNAVLIDTLRAAHTINDRFMKTDPDPISTIARDLKLDVRQEWRT